MNYFSKIKTTAGFTIVEVLIACAIISTSAISLLIAASKGIELSNLALRQSQANELLEEGAESVKILRDNGWSNISNLTLNTNYYLSFNNTTNTWSLTTTPVSAIDSIFSRNVNISAVYRDSNYDIASSGTLDTHIKKVTVNVSWPASSVGTASKSLVFYVVDIFS